MKRLVFALLLAAQQAWSAPTFLLKWDEHGEVASVDGVFYLGRDNDPTCSADMFADEIKSFNHIPAEGLIEIITKDTHSPDGLFLHKADLKNLNFSESNYLSLFLKTKDKVLFLGERCGSGGYFNIGNMIKLSEISKLEK